MNLGGNMKGLFLVMATILLINTGYAADKKYVAGKPVHQLGETMVDCNKINVNSGDKANAPVYNTGVKGQSSQGDRT